MAKKNKLETTALPICRANGLKSTIGALKKLRAKIEKEGEVAPKGCNIIRYQVRQNQKIYWYYKLQAYEPIFETIDGQKKTRYRYLGSAGSEAHTIAVMQVTRRAIIDEIDRMINTLEESYLDVCFGGEIKPDPNYYPTENKE